MINNKFISTSRSISYNLKNNAFKNKKCLLTLPNIWLFTDSIKTKNPIELAKKLPKKTGVVIRDYNSVNKEEIINEIVNIKNRRLLTLLIAGKHKRTKYIDGIHMPVWLKTSNNRRHKIISMSVHSAKDVRKSIDIKANIVFISPVFSTSSHMDKSCLGVIRLGLMAKLFKIPVIALGGINNTNITRLRNLPISGCAGIDVFL